jgi:hypothetical protein
MTTSTITKKLMHARAIAVASNLLKEIIMACDLSQDEKKKKGRERERRRRRRESNVDRTAFKFMKNTCIDIGVRMRSQTRPN